MCRLVREAEITREGFYMAVVGWGQFDIRDRDAGHACFGHEITDQGAAKGRRGGSQTTHQAPVEQEALDGATLVDGEDPSDIRVP